jgi:hypothetical protein
VAALLGGAHPARAAELRLTGRDAALPGSYDAADFARAVALVSAEPSPRALVERLGLDWEYLEWLAVDVSAGVLAESDESRGAVVSNGGEAFTAGLLIGIHLGPEPRPEAISLALAVDVVQERGRHAVIADYCDLAGVAALETVYSDALVESMNVAADERDTLRSPVTRIFEAGLAVGLELGSDGQRELGSSQP